MIDPELAGRVALVTGANAGIGAAIARALAAQGVSVALHYLDGARPPADHEPAYTREGRPAAEAVVREIESAGGRAVLVSGDLALAETPSAVFTAAEAALGPVSLLVNNAAHCELPDTVLETTPPTVDRHFSVNARAAVLLVRRLAEGVRRHSLEGGRVVNISTDTARVFPTQISYGASKAALESYTRSLAWELGEMGVTVNAVAPGPVQTGWITAEAEEQLLPWIPLGRVGTPEDIADAVVFLCSHQARWITGQVIQVAGGHAL
jgi:3-oxoacyl-[acyl-carrier protein] reductase